MNDNEQQVRDALRAVADPPGTPDHDAAWTRVRDRVDAVGPRATRRRVGVALAALAAAGAAAAALVVVAGQDDGREAVDVIPADTATTDVPPSTTILEATGTPFELPARPLAVVVDASGTQRLDLYDADTGEVVLRDLASSVHSISDVSFGPDGTLYFTEEFGDSSTVRMVAWDGSVGPTTPFDLEDETRSPALSPDGSTFAFVHQGVTTDGGRIGLVDTATGEVRYLDWAPDEDDFFLTNGTIDGLEWSPDGSKLLFTVGYEGTDVLVLDAAASSLSEATFLELSAFDVHWADDDSVVGLRFCCHPEFDAPRQLLQVGLAGWTEVLAAGEVAALDVGPGRSLAIVRPDGALDVVSDINAAGWSEYPQAVDVEHPVLDVGF